MSHDFSIVFDTENPLWNRVIEIFEKNEKYEKKVVSNRNLHHKFPRSFSKKLGEPIDNDKDNLISLSLAEHFLVHYYYYLLARKGYRQSMATAFTFMAKKCLKYMTPETAEAMAKHYEEAKCIANQGRPLSEETKRKIGEIHKGKVVSEDTRKKLSEAHKGKKRRPFTDVTKRKMSEAKKGRKCRPFTEEHKRKISESVKKRWTNITL